MNLFNVRDATREDCREVLRLIKELADYEKNVIRIKEKDLESHFFDLNPPLYFCYVVDDPNNPHKLIGYAIYYYHYGTWTGRKMYLRDIYVMEAYRGKGVGDALFKRVVQKGVETGCVDVDFTVLNWNPAENFYKARHAHDMTKKEGWHIFRLHRTSMQTVANLPKKSNLALREVRREDCKEVLRLIQELADFEKMSDGPEIDEKVLERDCFDISPPLFHCLVADDPNDSSKLVGYAFYYYGYGTARGQRMYLEDLYVAEAYRKTGLGHDLFREVSKKAVEMRFVDMDFVVLDWNPAQKFYKERGAQDITEKECWHLYRVHAADMPKVVESK